MKQSVPIGEDIVLDMNEVAILKKAKRQLSHLVPVEHLIIMVLKSGYIQEINYEEDESFRDRRFAEFHEMIK